MPFDYKHTTKIALTILFMGYFLVSSLKSQNFPSFTFGGPGVETINSIIISQASSNFSASDTLFLSGTFDQSFEWGNFYLETKGDQDIYIAVTDGMGHPIKVFAGGSFRDDELTNLIKLPNGTLILGGTYWGEGYFLDTLFANPYSSKNAFITAFTPDGIPIWQNFINGSGGITISSLALSEKNIYAAGTFENSLFIGDTAIHTDYPQNLWVAELNELGEVLKIFHCGATKNLDLIKMIALPQGGLALGGQFDEFLIFQDDTLKANTLDEDIFIFSLNTQLDINWYFKGGGVHRDALVDLVCNHQKQIIAAGDYVGRLTFPNGEELNSGDGIGDAFLISLDDNGNLLWKKNLTGPNFQGVHALHTVEQSIIVCGNFETDLLLDNERLASSTLFDRQVFLSFFNFNGEPLKTETFQNSAQFFPTQVFNHLDDIGITGTFANLLRVGDQIFNSPFDYQALVVNLNPTTTSVHNLDAIKSLVTLYPNPATNFISWNESLSFKRINLYHSNGLKIKSIESSLNYLHLSDLQVGNYFLQFITENGIIYSSSFVKN